MSTKFYVRIEMSTKRYEALKIPSSGFDFNFFIPCPDKLKKGYKLDDDKMAEASKVLWRESRDNVRRGINATKNAVKMSQCENIFSEFSMGKYDLSTYPVEIKSVVTPVYREEAEKALENKKEYGFATMRYWMENHWESCSNAENPVVKKCKKNTYIYFVTQEHAPFRVLSAVSKKCSEEVIMTFSSDAMPTDAFYEEIMLLGKSIKSGYFNRREDHSKFIHTEASFHAVYPEVFD